MSMLGHAVSTLLEPCPCMEMHGDASNALLNSRSDAVARGEQQSLGSRYWWLAILLNHLQEI